MKNGAEPTPPRLPPRISRRSDQAPKEVTAPRQQRRAPPLPAQRPKSTSYMKSSAQGEDASEPAPAVREGAARLSSAALTPKHGTVRRKRGMMPPPPLPASPKLPPNPTSTTRVTTTTTTTTTTQTTTRTTTAMTQQFPQLKDERRQEAMPTLQLPTRPAAMPTATSTEEARDKEDPPPTASRNSGAGLFVDAHASAPLRSSIASSLPPTPRAGIMTPVVRSPHGWAREQNHHHHAGHSDSFSTASMSSTLSLESHIGPDMVNEHRFAPSAGGEGRLQVEKKTLVRARVSYTSEEDGHLSFAAGQIIELLQQDDDTHTEEGHTLWKGRAIVAGHERVGVFPSVYVALMKSRLNSMGSADFPSSTGAGLPNNKELRKLNKGCISPENLEREARCGKLFRAIEELVETELRHVSDLSIVLKVFIMPFQDTFGPVLARQVFSDWVPLLRVHEQVLESFVTALPSLKQLAEAFESISNDPNVRLALRDEAGGEARRTPRAHVGLAPSNLAAFAEGVNQAARLGVGPTVARKGLGAEVTSRPGTPASRQQQQQQQQAVPSSSQGQDLMSSEDLDSFKHRLDFLSDLHREHLSDFMFLDDAQIQRWSDILRDMTVDVCRVMTEMSDWLKLCIPCVVNQPTAMKTLLRSKGANGATVSPKMFIQLQAHQERERLKNLDLASFLIKPMQRITKYPLLMREIRKYSEENSHAQEAAGEAIETMMRIATKVNDIMKQHQGFDHSKKVIEICAQLRPREIVDRLGLGSDSGCRRLYRYGKVTFQTLTTNVSSAQVTYEGDAHVPAAQLSKTEEIRHGSCYAMLFTSALLLSLKTLNKWKTKSKFHIVKVVEIGNIVSVESMDGCLAVRTACSVLLMTPLEGDVLEWLVDLQECRRVAAADRERQDVVKAQRKKRQGSSGRSKPRRTRSEDLSKFVRPAAQASRMLAGSRGTCVLSKEDKDGIICELKTHAKFSAAS